MIASKVLDMRAPATPSGPRMAGGTFRAAVAEPVDKSWPGSAYLSIRARALGQRPNDTTPATPAAAPVLPPVGTPVSVPIPGATDGSGGSGFDTLASLFTAAFVGHTAGATQDAPLAVVPVQSAASGGGVSGRALVIVGAIAAAGWWWWRKHHSAGGA